jgi:hypothetical protein
MEILLVFLFIPAIVKLVKVLFGAACHIIGGLLAVLGAILDSIAAAGAKAENQRQIEAAQAQRRQLEADRQRIRAAKEQEKQERAEAARIRQREQEQRRQQLHELKQEQARQDVVFYTETRRDIMKLYTSAEQEYKAAATDRAKETALRRMLAYDAKLRTIDKRRELAALAATN